MAVLVTIAIVVALAVVLFGAYLRICFAISREDRIKWSLRRDARTQSAQDARAFTGISGTRRND